MTLLTLLMKYQNNLMLTRAVKQTHVQQCMKTTMILLSGPTVSITVLLCYCLLLANKSDDDDDDGDDP